ncbi:MAG: serine hydrolase domain-containing protein [Bacillota bacterium]
MFQTAIPTTIARIEQGIADGMHLGAQLYISRNGQVVADQGIGEARPGEPMTPDHLSLWLSSTKPIAAVAIAQLWERGKLDLDDPVARYIPEFGVRGKEHVTLRHVLTHTGGFRGIAGTWTIRPWDQVIAHICRSALEPDWVPGHKAGYHVASGWFILGEVIRRIDTRPFDRYVREEIFLPLGMRDCWIGMPVEQYQTYGRRLAPMYVASEDGLDDEYAGNTQEGITRCRPGANGRGPIRELGRFYEMMLNRGRLPGSQPTQILRPQTVEALTARHRVGLYDHTFKHVLDWCLGFIPNNNYLGVETVPYGFGPHVSMRTFGHSGHQSSTAFADPEYNLVVALAFNGMPGEARHDQRIRAVLPAIYEDLGLA